MNARNQNIEQRSGLIENLRRYVGQNMLGLNENQDDDIQEIAVNTQDGRGQGRQEIRNRNGETMWWDQERISEDRSSTSTDYQPMPAPRLQPVAQSSPTSFRSGKKANQTLLVSPFENHSEVVIRKEDKRQKEEKRY
jgi:hypothetical protein